MPADYCPHSRNANPQVSHPGTASEVDYLCSHSVENQRYGFLLWRHGGVHGHINEELKAAKAAEAAINSLSTTSLRKSVFLATLNRANHAAILNFSSGGALNEARGTVGIVLSNLMFGPRTPEKIDKAKRAIEAWIWESEASPAA